MSDDLKETAICTCDCHKQVGVMHCMPCCDITYEQYFNEGRFDVEMFATAFTRVMGTKPTVKLENNRYYLVHK